MAVTAGGNVTIPGTLFTIQAEEKELLHGWNVNLTAQGQDTFSCSVVNEYVLGDPSPPVRPQIDEEVIFGLEFGGVWDGFYTVGTGVKSFHMAPDMGIEIGMRLRIFSKSGPGNYETGIVTAYYPSLTYPNVNVCTINIDIQRIAAGTYYDMQVGHILFGGQIEEPTEQLFGETVDTIETQINARAFNTWRQNVYVNGVIFLGSVKHAMEVLTDLFNFYNYDVSLLPSQPDGPTLPDMTLPFVRFDDVFKQIEGYSGYRINISADKIFSALDPTTQIAPFNVEDGNNSYIGNPSIMRSRSAAGADYANQVYVVWGGTPATVKRINIVSNTAANPTVITSATPHGLFAGCIVSVDGNVGSNESINSGDLPVTVISPTTFSVPKNCTVSGGTGGTFVRTDDLSLPIYAVANNLDEQINVRLRTLVVSDSKISTQEAAQAAAESILAMRSFAPRMMEYTTLRHGLRPGMTQGVNLPGRNFVNSQCMITDVSISAWENAAVVYRVKLIEGSIFQGSWQDVYKSWSGSTTAIASVTGSVSTGGQRALYPLGGSMVEFVQSPTPTWITATAARITIDTAERGSTSATVKIRLRATAGTVQARLYNVSLGVSVGTSIVVSSSSWPDWNTSAFSVALSGGTYDYELQVLPSLANTDVAAWGYLT